MSTRSPHYGLYQWEGSDPVSREEMNHNFSVLDEKLHEKLTYLPIKQFTNAAAAQLVSFDVSDIDWNAYHEVVVQLWCDSVEQHSATIYVNQDQSYQSDEYGSFMVPPSNTTVMVSTMAGLGQVGGFRGNVRFFCNQHETAQVTAECRSMGSGRTYHGWDKKITYSQMKTLDLYCYTNVPAGVQVKIWGVK